MKRMMVSEEQEIINNDERYFVDLENYLHIMILIFNHFLKKLEIFCWNFF